MKDDSIANILKTTGIGKLSEAISSSALSKMQNAISGWSETCSRLADLGKIANIGKFADLVNPSVLKKYQDINLSLPKFTTNAMPLVPKIINTKILDQIEDEREKINELMIESHYNSEIIQLFCKRIKSNPEYSSLVSISIIISILLTITCIAIPLLILPIDEYMTFDTLVPAIWSSLFTIKGLFVSLSTILICGIFIVFIVKNEQMKYSKEDLQQLAEFIKLENYSEYLKNYVKNTSED